MSVNRKKLLYLEVAQQIKKDILSGRYPVGSYIPTERELEEMFAVSKITVRNAVEILSNEGYLEKKSGKGTTVLSNRLFNRLSKANSFSSILEKQHELKKELMEIDVVDVQNNATLFEAFGESATCLKRMYYLDGEPYITFEHYFPVMSIKHAINEIESNSLYKWLALKGFDVAHFSDRFYVVVDVDPMIRKILKLEDQPVLCRERHTENAEGEVVEISYGYYNTDAKAYQIDYEI